MRVFTTTAAILFTVYPGFLKGPGVVTFSNHLLAYALAIYSILFTVVAIRANLEPNDRVEWMPLIEAYSYSSDLEQAENIILKLYGIPNLRENLCIYSLLQRANPNLTLPEEGMNFLTDRLCNSEWKSTSL